MKIFTPKKVIALAVFVVIFVLLFVVLPLSLGSIVKFGAERLGKKTLQADLVLGKVYISPLSGSALISDLSIGNPKGFGRGDALYAPEISVKMKPMAIFKKTIEVNRVVIKSPAINYIESGRKWSNIDQLQKNAESPSGDDKKSDGKKFVIKTLIIQAPTVRWYPDIPGHKAITIKLSDIIINDVGEGGSVDTTKIIAMILKKMLPSIHKNILKEMGKGKIQGIGHGIKDLFRKK
ncbi:MAG: hypothetical protein ABIE74_02725 [Pseudomonadota bacterium]